MPPFLSSLSSALLWRHPAGYCGNHGDVFALDLSAMAPEAMGVTISGASSQPPAAAMAVTYSLVLLGRCAPDIIRHPQPKIRSLPVKLDLHSEGSVTTHILPPPEYELASANHFPPHSSVATVDSSVASVEKRMPLSHASDMRTDRRHITIVTTAAIPWMTGTSVNPALRAIYLAKDGHDVTLVVPWLSTRFEQSQVFSKDEFFETCEQQAQYILRWAREQVPSVDIRIRFYQGAYSPKLCSILPIGAITDVFNDSSFVKDICILEEPEHLTWHHAGRLWTEIFNLVVGIIHTNYIEYTRNTGFLGGQRALPLLFLNMWVCRGYCHRIIKLSDAVQQFPNSITSNVHGVRDKFIDIGRARGSHSFPRGAYFMGKVLWAKGYRDLMDNMKLHYNQTGRSLPIDFFGAGPDVEEVQDELRKCKAYKHVNFDARVADPTGEWLQGYKVFVNASRSDVVCTATAEALAMGKLVVCLKHPSNEFFSTFKNCFTYSTGKEFGPLVERVVSMAPQPLSEQDAYRLTWEAATERLYDAVRLPLYVRRASTVDTALGTAHASLSKFYPQPGKKIRREVEKEAGSRENGKEEV